jgi:hypothetical protein
MSEGPEKGRFPFGKKDRESHREFYKGVAAHQAESEQNKGAAHMYTIYDSPLGNMPYADSSFDVSFSKLLESHGKTLRFYVENALENKRGKAVGIEFGGPGSQLFAAGK